MLRLILATILVGLFSVCTIDPNLRVQEPGFISLFDGKTLSGWFGDGKKYFSVESGVLVCKKGCHGKLLVDREFTDFVFRFDFKLTPGANNGLAIRSPKTGDTAFVGIEIQILDDSAKKYKHLKDYQYHGSAYGIVAAKRGALKPVGEWNTQEVRCKGRCLQVILNGQKIVDANLDDAAPNSQTIDGAKHPGLLRSRGYLGFLCHEDSVHFRNIRIKELSLLDSDLPRRAIAAGKPGTSLYRKHNVAPASN